jgi:hypothetical protein
MAAACVTSSETPPPPAVDAGPGIDAQGLPGFDGGTPVSDAPASPDSDAVAPPDAGPGTATITILAGGAPKAGVSVVFHDATGAVTDTKTSGVDGQASSVVGANAMITVALGGVGRRELFTIVGVKAGDKLVALDVPANSALPSLAVEIPAGQPAGTSTYAARSGIYAFGPAQPPVTLPADVGSNGKAPVVLYARDRLGADLGFAFKKGIVPVQGGTASVTGLSSWATAFGSFSVGGINLPRAAECTLMEIADEVALTQNGLVNPDPAKFRTLPGYADAFQSELELRGNGGILTAVTFVTTRTPPPIDGAAQTFDATTLLPALTGAKADTTDIARPRITWTASGSLATTIGAFARVSYLLTRDGGQPEQGGWSFVAPPGVTSIDAPVLPASLAAWVPNVTFVNVDALGFMGSDLVPSYDAFRARYLTYTSAFQLYRFIVPLLPAAGTLVGSILYNAG